ncbi:metal-sensitive transcriptional regulator [Dactylosporangium siamense]|uniref:Metal-sensitive transcriptional regulator n=2 Tax=Dactylosporangium TaxID=35753 RepID=A0A919UIR3_9ACTN|nr:hypothetical protein Dsi01nite_099690 [Dactylosporangium siamense]
MGTPANLAYPRGVCARMAGMTTATPRGYTATKDQLQSRLRRIEGQVRGVEKMVDEDRYCIDVLTQISAIQAALDKVALGLLDGHTRHCMQHGAEDGKGEEMATEMMAAVGRLLRRG